MKLLKVRSKILAPIVAAAFIVGIGLSMAFNLWQTESSKEPIRYTEGEFAGEYNPADIRGSYTFGDIEAAFLIPADILAKAYGIQDEDDADGFAVKELEELYGVTPDGGEIGTDSVRLFVALYLGLPYTPEESSRLPSSALSFLKDRLTVENFEETREIAVQLNEIRISGTVPATEEDHDDEEIAVKGKTTFDDLLNWGLTQGEIEKILGISMGSRGSTVRDFVTSQGLEFSEFKTKLQELLDSKSVD